MKQDIIHYFLSSNSSKGYKSFLPSALDGLSKASKLTGYPPEMMSQIADRAQTNAQEIGLQLELIHNPLDNSIEGIIVPEKKSGIFNTPLYIEDSSHVFHLCTCPKKTEIAENLSQSHAHFAEALKIHDEWEKIYISNLNADALNKLTEETIVRLLSSCQENIEKGARKDRYFGAATFSGATDYILNITEDIPKRYFLKGRPGTGKSTFLKKIARQAMLQGLDTEIYHCAFDPDSLDLIAIRSLGLCIFDSTAPHEYFPSRSTDEVIDIYDIAVAAGTDERYENELKDISSRYKEKIASATECLKKAKTLYDEMNAQIMNECDASLCADTIARLSDGLFD